MAVVTDLYITQGQTETLVVRWSENGEDVDLTGCGAELQIRETVSSEPALLSYAASGSTGGFDTLFDEDFDGGLTLSTDGYIVIVIPAEDSSALVVSEDRPTKQYENKVWVDLGVYDLEVSGFSSGETVRLIQGRTWLSPEVTR